MRGSAGGGGGGGPGDPPSCPRSRPRSRPPCPLPRQDSFYSGTSPPLSLQWRNLSGQSWHQGTVGQYIVLKVLDAQSILNHHKMVLSSFFILPCLFLPVSGQK